MATIAVLFMILMVLLHCNRPHANNRVLLTYIQLSTDVYFYTLFIGSTLARMTLDNEVLSTLLGKVTEITSPEVITGTYVTMVTPLLFNCSAEWSSNYIR